MLKIEFIVQVYYIKMIPSNLKFGYISTKELLNTLGLGDRLKTYISFQMVNFK